jgi:hypothetical protein
VLGFHGHLAPVPLGVEAGLAGLAGQHLIRALEDLRFEFFVHCRRPWFFVPPARRP